MKKIHLWEANDLAGDYEERGFHPTKWEEVTEFDEEGYGWVCTDNGWGFVNQEGYLVIPDDYEMIQYPFFENGYCIAKKEGKLGIFDRKNYEVFPFIYDQLFGDLSAEIPKVVVALNGKWKMMDIHRNTILPLVYDDILVSIINILLPPELREVSSLRVRLNVRWTKWSRTKIFCHFCGQSFLPINPRKSTQLKCLNTQKLNN